jgi:hypothetical protein
MQESGDVLMFDLSGKKFQSPSPRSCFNEEVNALHNIWDAARNSKEKIML